MSEIKVLLTQHLQELQSEEIEEQEDKWQEAYDEGFRDGKIELVERLLVIIATL